MDKNKKSKPTHNTNDEKFSHNHSKKEVQALKAMLSGEKKTVPSSPKKDHTK